MSTELQITFVSINPNPDTKLLPIYNVRNNEYIKDLEGFKINFILNDNNITNEFIKAWKNSKSTVLLSKETNEETHHDDVNSYLDSKISNIHYSVYQYKNVQTIKKEINKVIRELENQKYPIDKNLILDESLSIISDIEMYKLNCLHEYFEDNTTENIDHDIFVLLEKINQYVHELEKPSIDNRAFFSIRKLTSNKHFNYPSYQLADEDYNTFEIVRSGYLYLDYATVGKDLPNCFSTNDIELVSKKKVSPQMHCKPNVQFCFSDEKSIRSDIPIDAIKNRQYLDYYNWCETNNVEQFYNYKLPIHNLGRALLGKMKQHITYEDFKDQFKKYPYIINIKLI
tara:strand:+ start:397 stop:1419 length:1023 start_codon:yes stop_codon:yes gene_type:complete